MVRRTHHERRAAMQNLNHFSCLSLRWLASGARWAGGGLRQNATFPELRSSCCRKIQPRSVAALNSDYQNLRDSDALRQR